MTTPSDPSHQSQGRDLLTPALLVTGLSSVAYAVAFAFEYGYVHTFGLPIWVVRVDLNQVLIAAAGLYGLWQLVYWGLVVIPTSVLKWRPVVRAGILPTFILLLLLLYLLTGKVRVWAIALLLFLFWLLLQLFVLAPLRRFKEGSLPERFAQEDAREIEQMPETLLTTLLRRTPALGVSASALMNSYFAFLFVILGAHLAGHRVAMSDRRFLISANARTLIAIRRYSDQILALEIDTLRYKVMPRLHYIPLDNSHVWVARRFTHLTYAPGDSFVALPHSSLPKSQDSAGRDTGLTTP